MQYHLVRMNAEGVFVGIRNIWNLKCSDERLRIHCLGKVHGEAHIIEEDPSFCRFCFVGCGDAFLRGYSLEIFNFRAASPHLGAVIISGYALLARDSRL